MAIVIGVFDEQSAVENVVNKLAASGFEEHVFEPSSLSQESGGSMPRTHVAGTPPTPGSTGLAGLYSEEGRQELLQSFREHLEKLDLADDQVRHYVEVFDHGGRFVTVKTDSQRVEEAMSIMRAAGGSQVHHHG